MLSQHSRARQGSAQQGNDRGRSSCALGPRQVARLPSTKQGGRVGVVRAAAKPLDTSPQSTWAALSACREKSPLVQCITNFVSMDIMANTLLAAGASPAMAHSIGEVEDFVGISSALLVNVGTLADDWVGGMRLGAKAAVALGKPWVLDPVGCGATPYRTQVLLGLLKLKPTVVRGNASEIMALAGVSKSATKGVDSTAAATEALDAARSLAASRGCVVAVSGAQDLVTDGRRVLRVANGVPLLQQVTATGCSVTALIAAFVSCHPQQPLEATAHVLAYLRYAAELSSAQGARHTSIHLRVVSQGNGCASIRCDSEPAGQSVVHDGAAAAGGGTGDGRGAAAAVGDLTFGTSKKYCAQLLTATGDPVVRPPRLLPHLPNKSG